MSEMKKLSDKMYKVNKDIEFGRQQARDHKDWYWLSQGVNDLERIAWDAIAEADRLQKIVDDYEREKGRAYDRHLVAREQTNERDD